MWRSWNIMPIRKWLWKNVSVVWQSFCPHSCHCFYLLQCTVKSLLRPDKETRTADPCTLYNAVCSCSLSYFPPFFCETCFKKLASKFNPWAHQPVLVQNYFKKSVQISCLSLLTLFCSGFPCENRWHRNRGRVTSHLGKQWSSCLLS